MAGQFQIYLCCLVGRPTRFFCPVSWIHKQIRIYLQILEGLDRHVGTIHSPQGPSISLSENMKDPETAGMVQFWILKLQTYCIFQIQKKKRKEYFVPDPEFMEIDLIISGSRKGRMVETSGPSNCKNVRQILFPSR